MEPDPLDRPVILVTGMSGAGKASVLRVLEDLGYEVVDNPPLAILGDLLAEPGEAPLAIGIDARTRGMEEGAPADVVASLKARGAIDLTLVFLTADEEVLQRRFSETRRRHPLAPGGQLGSHIPDGIAREAALLAPLRDLADWVLDTSALALPDLRRMVERRFGAGGPPGMSVSVQSFAFPRGVPRDADLVLDMRFLRNPHYDPVLRPQTGRDPAVAHYIERDADYAPFWRRMTALLDPLLPRYAAEGKKYLTIALGCTGGKHRSVLLAERLAAHLAGQGWRVDLSHRELGIRERFLPSATHSLSNAGGEAAVPGLEAQAHNP